MELSRHTVLVTGGASGIGLGIAQSFLKEGSTVIVCGRREEKLKEVKAQHPAVHTRACDLTQPAQRAALAQWAVSEFPALDVLVNNAGIQRHLDLTKLDEPWATTHEEIAINFEAQVHLTQLLIPHFLKQRRPAFINITSGLAMVPLAAAPIYSSTKAAFHSYTHSLRRQLVKTPIAVIEIAPPAVNTDLGGVGRHDFGVPLAEFIGVVAQGLKGTQAEISYGFSEQSFNADRATRDRLFERMNPKQEQA